MIIKDKIFVVTGAGGGIGGAVVGSLLRQGAKVAAVDLRQEALDKLKNNNSEHVKNLSVYAIDITDKQAVLKLPEQVVKKQGAVDGLINCAGVIQQFVKINDIDYQDVDRVFRINFYGTLYMVKAFLPHLLKRPEGYVANVSSMGGFLPVPGQSIYGASKAAVKLMTEGLYAELIDTNVHVSVIYPGATSTDIAKNSGVNASNTAASEMKIPMLSAYDCAEAIIKGIEKNKPYIYTGKDSKIMNLLYRFNSVYATKLIAKQMQSLLK